MARSWISWPKKASGVLSDLSENIIREIGLSSRVVDVGFIAIDETWSRSKFAYRLLNCSDLSTKAFSCFLRENYFSQTPIVFDMV